MGKIGFAIKKTVEGAQEPRFFNKGSWATKVVDIRNSVLERIKGFESSSSQIRLLSFIEDGTYYVTSRPITGDRPNDNVSIWVFFPWKCVLKENEIHSLLDLVDKCLADPELNADKIQEVTEIEYVDQLAPQIKSSRGEELAFRYFYSKDELVSLIGPCRYQEYYRNYKYVVLLDSESEIKFIDTIANLNSQKLDEPLAIMPPETEWLNKIGIVRDFKDYVKIAINNIAQEAKFKEVVFVNKGDTVSLLLNRDGFVQIIKDFVPDKNQYKFELELPLVWKKAFSKDSFHVVDANTTEGRKVKDYKIFINGEEVKDNPVEISEDDCNKTEVVIEAPGYETYNKTVSLLTTDTFPIIRAPKEYSWRIETIKGDIELKTITKKRFDGIDCPLHGYYKDYEDNLLRYDQGRENKYKWIWGTAGFLMGIIASVLLYLSIKYNVLSNIIDLLS